jgi:hypothetical protein
MSSNHATIGARKDTDTEEFRLFKRDLTHRSIVTMLLPLKPFMTTPDIVACPDGYFHRVIYGPGPHIADYPEQATLTWILFGWCPTQVRRLLTPTSTNVLLISSCLAHPHSLDTPCRHRSAAHTDVLLGLHDEETLRKTYGIAPGSSVCI